MLLFCMMLGILNHIKKHADSLRYGRSVTWSNPGMTRAKFPQTIYATQRVFNDYGADDMRYGDIDLEGGR